MKKKIALTGCGALGRVVVEHFDKTIGKYYELVAVMDRHMERAESAAQLHPCKACTSLPELLSEKPDIVIEIASGEILRAFGREILEAGADLIAVSVGALADPALYRELEETAARLGRKVYVPSGAIGGLDVMRTLSLMGGLTARIDNQKAPGSLNGAPYLGGEALPEDAAKRIFDGNVREAIAGFPKNVNVAVATALASGDDNTRVIIESVPGMQGNRHAIHLGNGTVQADITITSAPDPANPKSSTMTAFSVLALLKNLAAPISYF